LAATPATAAVPARLHSGTLHAVLLSGADPTRAGVSPQVVALVQEVSRAMLFSRISTAAVLVLALCLVPAAAFFLPRQDPPAPEFAPLPEPEPEPSKPPALAPVKRTFEGHEKLIWAVALSRDGKKLATVSGLYNEPGELILWDRATGKQLAKVMEEKGLRALAFSPDGKTLATCNYYANQVALRDAETGKVRTLLPTGRANNAVAFSPDGKGLAVAILNRTAQLWDVATGRKLHELEGHTDWVPHVAWSPDGKLLATGTRDKTVKLWDPTTGKERATLSGHEGTIEFIAFSPDGRTMATAGWDKTVRIWEVASGKERARLTGHQFQVLSVAFTPDGRTLASTSGEAHSPITDTSGKPGEIRLWDVATRKEIASLAGHQYRVWMALFPSDGKTLITCAEDKATKLWDYTPRQPAPLQDAAAKELEACWENLAGDDATRAGQAIWGLATSKSAAFLTKHLKPATPEEVKDLERMQRLVRELDSDTFEVREKASEELEKLGRGAEKVLRSALEGGKLAAEARRRAQDLLDKIPRTVLD